MPKNLKKHIFLLDNKQHWTILMGVVRISFRLTYVEQDTSK